VQALSQIWALCKIGQGKASADGMVEAIATAMQAEKIEEKVAMEGETAAEKMGGAVAKTEAAAAVGMADGVVVVREEATSRHRTAISVHQAAISSCSICPTIGQMMT